jgi:ribosome recycling factor
MQQLFRDVELKMKEAVEHLHHELKQVRAGRASTAILEGVVVDYYGSQTPLQQIAGLSVGDASLLVVQPYDPSQISAIERAIQASGLGLNPRSDGRVLRVPIPPLTEERRKEMVKRAHDMAEKCRTSIRQARRDGNDKLKKMEREHAISQDDEKRGHDEVQMLHDHYIAEVAKTLEHKEKDILEV